MKRNTMIFLLIVLVASMVAAGSVAAQTTDADQRGPDRPALPDRARVDVATIVADALGIEADALRDALIEDGATLDSVIAANGGDSAAIQQQIVDAIVEATGQDAETVAERVADHFSNERPSPRDGQRGPGGRGGQGGPNGEGRPAQPPAGGVDA